MKKRTWAIKYLARHSALDADSLSKMLEMQDGGPGSGNHGHKGRPGKRGGSAAKGEGGGSAGSTGSGLTKEQEAILNAGRKAFNKMHGLPESAEAYPEGGKPLSKLIGKSYLSAPDPAVKKIFGNNKPVIGIRKVTKPDGDEWLLVSSLPYTGGERIMYPARRTSAERAAKEWCKANKIDPDKNEIEAIWNPDQRGWQKSFKVGNAGTMKEPVTWKITKAELAKADKEYWQRHKDVDNITKSDMEFALGMMHGSRYDPEYPKESREEVELKKDLEWVNESKSRDEFVERGEPVKAKWDEYIKNDEYYDGPSDVPWWNPYNTFNNCLEREQSNQKVAAKALSWSSGAMKEPYGIEYGSKHGSMKRDKAASEEMMKDFAKKCSPPASSEEVEKYLGDMEPGTAFRWKEPGKKKNYDWAIKNKDGSFTFTSKLDGSQETYTAGTLAADIAESGKGDSVSVIGEFCVPEKGSSSNDAYWTAKRQFAQLDHTPGDDYKGKRVSREESVKNCKERAAGAPYPKEQGNGSAEYTQVTRDGGKLVSAGKPVGILAKGSGVTGIDRGDLMSKNPDDKTYNTLGEHCMEDANGNLVLTPEREELHQQIVSDLFKNARKPADGKKVATFLGGGSAAGKGTIQGKESGVDFPSEKDSPVLDADKIKEMLPEYVDTAFSDDHEQAASYAHEESSSLVKRAMQAAMANGYSYTLDGTGDGSLKSMKKKIDEARANGYAVNGVYVTCPTEKAVERSIGRSKTDKYGRLVKPETVRDIHQKVSQLFPDIAPEMDHCDLYDTDQGGKPVLIATCDRGGPIKVLNKKLYQAFLDKGKG